MEIIDDLIRTFTDVKFKVISPIIGGMFLMLLVRHQGFYKLLKKIFLILFIIILMDGASAIIKDFFSLKIIFPITCITLYIMLERWHNKIYGYE